MKLILSRKGFDETAGGGASPIWNDGRMLSLPIPEPTEGGGSTTYAELSDIDGTNYLEILHSLGYSKFGPTSSCHLDPDLIPSVRQRSQGWRGMLGQADSSAGHLAKQGVGPGDLILFWGRYAHTEAVRSFKGQQSQHCLFGYLEIDEVINAGTGSVFEEAPYHPHFTPPYQGRKNLVYVASERFSHDRRLPGWGVFRWSPRLTLSAPGSTGLTLWRLPACFHPSTGSSLTYHPNPAIWSEPDRHGYVTVERKGQGQEFVCDATPDIRNWALDIVRNSVIWSP